MAPLLLQITVALLLYALPIAPAPIVLIPAFLLNLLLLLPGKSLIALIRIVLLANNPVILRLRLDQWASISSPSLLLFLNLSPFVHLADLFGRLLLLDATSVCRLPYLLLLLLLFLAGFVCLPYLLLPILLHLPTVSLLLIAATIRRLPYLLLLLLLLLLNSACLIRLPYLLLPFLLDLPTVILLLLNNYRRLFYRLLFPVGFLVFLLPVAVALGRRVAAHAKQQNASGKY
ncbi:MAG: hypothetical protein ACKVRN_07060 [Pyrinomonadaceae bacterium]